MPPQADIDRNLLFGVIALQDDFIDQAQFADVCAGWAMRMDRALGELLVERGWIVEADRAEIERKLERKLKKHRNDPRATLASLADAPLRDLMNSIPAPPVHKTMQELAPATGHRLVETLVPPSDQRSSLRYTLSRMHAQGGLGKIWVARDTDLNREVALKEIRIDRSANPEAWRRFMKEAQVTGQLEHPNIVPVYELARRKEDDQPFYTMRFVRGETLRSAIAEFHRARKGKALDRLELQRRLLEPFVKVCQAIGYAHSRGVVHRDLKPENIVLGPFGEVVVLDWGLAKILSEADEKTPADNRVTVTAEAETHATQGAVGTPAYMAPEQASGQSALIDARTDIYGLGGILFEILTGRPPAEADTMPDLLHKVMTGNIPDPRTVDGTVPKPLAAVCKKALALRREDRYQSADDLAEDVRRWLVDERVSVYRDPLLVRASRWARRHRTLVASAAVLLLSTIAALAMGIYLINRERDRTEQQRRLAVSNAQSATRNMKRAQDAADTLLAEVGDVDLAEIPQMESVRKRLLEKARAGYEQFYAESSSDPLIEWGRSRALVRLADIQALLGEYASAEESYRQGLKSLVPLSEREPKNRDVRRDLARARHGLGVLLKDEARFQEAIEELKAAIGEREELSSLPNPDPQDTLALADSTYQLGTLLARQGARSAADGAQYAAAIKALDQLAQSVKERPDSHVRRARYRNNQGILFYSLGRLEEAGLAFDETLQSLATEVDASGASPGARWQYARAANNLAGVFLGLSRPTEAEPLLTRAGEILQGLAAEFPGIASYRVELAAVAHNQGLLEQKRSRPVEAGAAFGRAVDLLRALKDESPRTPRYRSMLANYEFSFEENRARSDPAAAEAGIREALKELDALIHEYPDVLEYQNIQLRGEYLRARCLMAEHREQDAQTEIERALAAGHQLLAREPGSDRVRRNLVDLRAAIVENELARGRVAEAATAAESLLDERPDVAESYFRAAVLLVQCAHHAEGPVADDCRRRAVAVLKKALEHGLAFATELLDDPALAELRDREDFKAVRDRASGGPVTG
jgi:serine/threonine protein kinase